MLIPTVVNKHGVDFEQVVQNAAAQGIDLSEITLFYEGLSVGELSELKRHELLADQRATCVLGKFNKEGIALFPEKVTGVYCLSS